jgi:ubiquinone/menaquinone biosynthesis C-methylase UbiE
MFKSFHHIPTNLMQKALEEIKRVLKPNGLLYISQALYTDQDEEQVLIDAFEHIKEAVENEQFKLFRELFFQSEDSIPFRVDILQKI